jgi:hypothetical protein
MLVIGHLFQARMWIEYAMMWDDDNHRLWVKNVLQVSRKECLRRARENLRLAKEKNNVRLRDYHDSAITSNASEV